LVTYRKLPEGSIAICCGAVPVPSLTEPIPAIEPSVRLTLNSRIVASDWLAT
jgi:hypothetical protein